MGSGLLLTVMRLEFPIQSVEVEGVDDWKGKGVLQWRKSIEAQLNETIFVTLDNHKR